MAAPAETVMTRTLPTGSESCRPAKERLPRRQPTGFTLVELLIVLTLLAVLTAVLAPVLLPSPGRALREAASEVATTLRETRRHARADQKRRRFLVDTQSGQFGIEDTPSWRSLPDDMSVELTTAESLLTGETRGGIDFFPDGSSTGGRVLLGMADQSVQVDIEWLTGRIRISSLAEQ
jgi:general secretion pathway protein H